MSDVDNWATPNCTRVNRDMWLTLQSYKYIDDSNLSIQIIHNWKLLKLCHVMPYLMQDPSASSQKGYVVCDILYVHKATGCRRAYIKSEASRSFHRIYIFANAKLWCNSIQTPETKSNSICRTIYFSVKSFRVWILALLQYMHPIRPFAKHYCCICGTKTRHKLVRSSFQKANWEQGVSPDLHLTQFIITYKLWCASMPLWKLLHPHYIMITLFTTLTKPFYNWIMFLWWRFFLTDCCIRNGAIANLGLTLVIIFMCHHEWFWSWLPLYLTIAFNIL